MQDKIEDIILNKIGTEGLSEEARQEMLDDVSESVQNYFIAFSYQKLGEDDKIKLEALIDAGDEAGQTSFLEAKIPDHSAVLQQAVDQTIEDIKGAQAELDAELAATTTPTASAEVA